jgi:hypothetical protein
MVVGVRPSSTTALIAGDTPELQTFNRQRDRAINVGRLRRAVDRSKLGDLDGTGCRTSRARMAKSRSQTRSPLTS